MELSDPTGVSGDAFGTAVAVSGTTLAVGAPGVNGGLGAVYLYGRTGTTWTLQATLTAADATQPENYGATLALSGDTLVVGAYAQHSGNGAIYIYARTGGVWRQQAEFGDPGGVPDAEFGWSVALSGDTVVVGAPNVPEAAVYVRSGGVWAFQAALHAAHAPALFFGISVAVSGDTALVGACCDTLGRQTGAVYVFGRSGSAWSDSRRVTGSATRDGCASLYPAPRVYGIVYGMHKTTIYLPDDLKADLERTAAEVGRSEAALIREGIQLILARRLPPRPQAGIFDGGDPHLSERVDDLLRDFGRR